jgi:hypothetical protein
MIMWTPFDFLIIIGGLCSLSMVLGGILLLYKGAITLDKRPTDSAVDVEFKRFFKITTSYPALGIFVIGLAFLVSTIMLVRPDTKPIVITGTLDIPDPDSATIYVSTVEEIITPDSDGTIKGKVFPKDKSLNVRIVAPGFIPPDKTKRIDPEEKEMDLGVITYEGERVPMPAVLQENISEVAGTLPPLDQSGSFR